jgi:hypothetical protein
MLIYVSEPYATGLFPAKLVFVSNLPALEMVELLVNARLDSCKVPNGVHE